MAKKKRDRKVQKNLQITDATFAPPPYERVSLKSNTEYFKKHKSKNICTDSNLCQCHESGQPKTWQSIANMYGDQDTTKVWNNKEQIPVTVFNRARWNKKDKNRYPKKSKGINYKQNDKRKNALHGDNVIKDEHPIIDIKLKKNEKSKKKKALTHPDATGDSCVGGPCRTSLALNYIPQNRGEKQVTKKKNEVNRTNINVHKKVIMEAQGDRTIPSATEKKESKSHPSNFISKLKNLASIHKVNSKVLNEPIKREPMFEMKVDSKEIRVLNPREVQMNVKKFGLLEEKQCICPSRLSASKNVCNRGICERALIQRNGRFKCRCDQKHSIECEETTCDSKNNLIKKNRGKSSKYETQNNPLFEVMIDSNMTVLNSHEIKNILDDANNKICPTGICNVAAKKHINLNCKCLNKKIIPNIKECTLQTCHPHKRCKLFYLCSRIFSKSENLSHYYQEAPQLRRREYISSDHKTRRIKKSYNTKLSRVPKEIKGIVPLLKSD